MNRTEFNEFLIDFDARFPGSADWLADKPSTRAMWFRDTFSALSLADCMTVSLDIQNGRTDGWESYDRERVPAVYARAVGAIRSARRRKKDQRATHNEYRVRRARMQRDGPGGIKCDSLFAHADAADPAQPSMVEAFRKSRELKASGASPDEISEMLSNHFGV